MKPKYTNALIHETSPYLLQHAHNPVNWLPYSKEVFEHAQREQKLILFSIGYAACHWCHVMEHESFEDETVAKIMNDHFICVKIDREERPDVDQIYMNAVQLLTGSGGWPLNCFALPDGRPVWGGTYFRPKDWTHILEQLYSGFKETPQKFEQSAQQLTQGLTQSELITQKSTAPIFSKEAIRDSIKSLAERFDFQHGGFMGQPKFPMPNLYEMLLDYALINHDESILHHIKFTLKKWAYGGIYDQLGSGFARYSVDQEWLVPHFEKMLYDNGQILSLFSKAYRIYKDPTFKRIVNEMIEWLQREMSDTNDLFYASYDADSEGVEGKFYVWNKSDVEAVLGENSKDFCDYYGISEQGNFEGANILNVSSMIEANAAITKQKNKLFLQREKRVKPSLDNKQLTSWNALVISGLCEAYKSTQSDKAYQMALKAAKAILSQNINKKAEVLRLLKPKNSVHGFAEDYSLIIKAFIDLYEISLDETWLNWSILIQEKANDLFYNEASGMYYYTSKTENVIVRKMETSDNVIPSSNGIFAHNLLRLSNLTEREDYKEKAIQLAKNAIGITKQSPSYAYQWLKLYQDMLYPKQELVIIGKDAAKKMIEFNTDYYPNLLVIGTKKENNQWPLLANRWHKDKTLLYYCVANSCQVPETDVEAIKAKL